MTYNITMEKIALYRKYRPVDFKAIYGQKSVVQTLLNSIQYNRVNHAYIFSGNKGSGKTSLAKIFSKAINCLQPIEGNPCNTCENCIAVNNNLCMDIIELDAASNSGINEIKNIIESVVFMPTQLKYRVYIIDEAHMLTTNSWNALLKTLEEPPAHAILIFATTEYHKIPATIVSRCQRYDFSKISFELLVDLITDVSKKENIEIDKESINTIALLANGAARDALSILDQLANYTNNHITVSLINEMFGLLDINTKAKYINAIMNHDVEAVINMIEQFSQSGINFNILINELVQIMMDHMVYLLTNNSKLLQILDVNTVDLIDTKNTDELLRLIGIYNDNANKLKNTEHPKFIFEYISILACDSNNTNKTSKPEFIDTIPIKNKNENLNKFSLENIKPAQPQIITPTQLEMPEIKDDLFNTSSRLVLKPAEKTVVEVQNNLQNLLDEKIDNSIQSFQSPYESIPTIELETFKVEPVVKNIEKIDEPQSNTNENKKMIIKSTDDNHINLDNIYDEVYKNTFFAIAANHDKNKKDKFNQVLSDFKETPIIDDPSLNAFLNADKFLVTSKNGVVLLFEEEAQVIRFNKISNTDIFIDFFQELFQCQQLVIGVYKLQALGLKKEYQNLVKKDFKDVKINNVLKDIKKTKLLDILNFKDDNDNGDSE